LDTATGRIEGVKYIPGEGVYRVWCMKDSSTGSVIPSMFHERYEMVKQDRDRS
jgi:hypothetical protein